MWVHPKISSEWRKTKFSNDKWLLSVCCCCSAQGVEWAQANDTALPRGVDVMWVQRLFSKCLIFICIFLYLSIIYLFISITVLGVFSTKSEFSYPDAKIRISWISWVVGTLDLNKFWVPAVPCTEKSEQSQGIWSVRRVKDKRQGQSLKEK